MKTSEELTDELQNKIEDIINDNFDPMRERVHARRAAEEIINTVLIPAGLVFQVEVKEISYINGEPEPYSRLEVIPLKEVK
jgi:hypothetical protein